MMPADTNIALNLAPENVELLGRRLARVLMSGRADG
jgi:hypothetical protein